MIYLALNAPWFTNKGIFMSPENKWLNFNNSLRFRFKKSIKSCDFELNAQIKWKSLVQRFERNVFVWWNKLCLCLWILQICFNCRVVALHSNDQNRGDMVLDLFQCVVGNESFDFSSTLTLVRFCFKVKYLVEIRRNEWQDKDKNHVKMIRNHLNVKRMREDTKKERERVSVEREMYIAKYPWSSKITVQHYCDVRI